MTIASLIVHPSILHCSFKFLFYIFQHRRMMKLEAAYKYKSRVDARESLVKRRAEEEKDLPQDPLDDLFTEGAS